MRYSIIKIILLVVIALQLCYGVSSQSSFDCDNSARVDVMEPFIEGFEKATKDVYADGTVQCEAGEWRFYGAIVSRLNNEYNQDKRIGQRVARLRLSNGSSGSTGDNGYIEMITPKKGGVGKISLYHATYGQSNVDANSTWRLQISKNGGEFESFGEEIISSNELTQVVFTPMLEGEIRIRITKTDGTSARLNIDNIEMTSYNGMEPILFVNPSDVDFGNIQVGVESEKKFITVLGIDLTSNIGYEVVGADADYFDIVKGDGWDNLAGGKLEIVFLPMLAKAYNAKLVVKSVGVQDVNVDIKGVGDVLSLPVIVTAVSDGVGFNTIMNTTSSKLINVKGFDLKQNITLSMSGSEYFSINVDVISKDVAATEAGANVAITYSPLEEGTHSGIVTLSSDGAEPVSVDLSGVSNPEPDNMINNGSFEEWETDAVPSYWAKTLQIGASLTKEELIKNAGQYSVCLDYKDGTGTSTLLLIAEIAVEGGASYLLSFDYYFEATTTGNGGRIWGVWKDDKGKEIKENNLKPNGYIDKSEKEIWKPFSILVTAPENAVTLALEIRWYANSKLYVDNMKMVYAGDVVIPVVQLSSDEFTGTVEMSKKLLVSITGSNLIPNSSLNISLTGEYFSLKDEVIEVNNDGEIDDVISLIYCPATLGTHNATITITGGGLLSPATGMVNANSVRPTPPIADEATDIDATSFTANWQSEQLGKYLLTVQDDSNVLISDIEINDIRYNVADLSENKTYYYYVKTKTNNYSSMRSNIVTVTTKKTDINDVEADRVVVRYDYNTLFVDFDEAIGASITMYDMNGRVIFSDITETTRYSRKLDVMTGIYVVKISFEDKKIAKKIIIE